MLDEEGTCVKEIVERRLCVCRASVTVEATLTVR